MALNVQNIALNTSNSESQYSALNANNLQTDFGADKKSGTLQKEDITQFIEMTPNKLVVLNDKGQILRSNEHFSNNFTIPSGRDFVSLFHAKDAPRISAVLKRACADKTSKGADNYHACECCMIASDGAMRWMRWEVFPSKDAQTLHAIGRDITPVKLHEQALLRKQTELYEAESIARMGRWHWDIGDKEMSWSPELYRIFGKDSNDFSPSLDGLCDIVDPQDSDRILQIFQRAMIERTSYEIDMRIGEKDSEGERIVRCEGRCEMDADGDVVSLYGIMQDITAQVLHERDLNNAKEEAERACASKTQFLANMSHELRTPLNAIIGFSEIIQSQLLGPFGNEKYGEYVNSIHESGQHLLALISDILDMSRIHSGKYTLAREDINIAKLSCLAAHMMEGSAQEAGVTISVDEDNNSDKLSALADRRAVMQITLNILSNAIKFTPKGGGVKMSCNRHEGGVEITITDTGIGIPSKHLQRIMMPFEQVDSDLARQHDGSGLGLAITKDLVDLHEGRLSIESAVNKGTKVSVWLPCGESCSHSN